MHPSFVSIKSIDFLPSFYYKNIMCEKGKRGKKIPARTDLAGKLLKH